MRSKEGAKDYRFFPEPDLPPLVVGENVIEDLAAQLPELPEALKDRLCETYGLSSYESSVLVNEAGSAQYFEEVAGKPTRPSKVVVNWVLNDLFGHLKAANGDIATCPVSAAHLGELIDLIVDGTISGKIGKDVLELMFYENAANASPLEIVEAKNWKQIGDINEIRALCQAVLEDPVRSNDCYGLVALICDELSIKDMSVCVFAEDEEERGRVPRGQDAALRLLHRPSDEEQRRPRTPGARERGHEGAARVARQELGSCG